MALTTKTYLGEHLFDGPYTIIEKLPDISGVYIITTLNMEKQHLVIDVGESEKIKTRISSHDRSDQWQNNAIDGIFAWILPSNEAQRMIIENAHRLTYNPICGDR